MKRLTLLAVLLLPLPAGATELLTLERALSLAKAHAPGLKQAHANLEAAQARSEGARAPLLPQVSSHASYQRATANAVSRGSSPAVGAPSFDTYDGFNFGLSASTLLYDFGQAQSKWQASQALAEAQEGNERTAQVQAAASVRTAFFAARTSKVLVNVAAENLANQTRHFKQIQGFVTVGTRPAIDLAQVRTANANARVQLINAENTYATAKAQLNAAMGLEGAAEFEVGTELPAVVPGEESSTKELLAEALAARSEFVSLAAQQRAQVLTLQAAEAGMRPAISASTALTDAGAQFGNLGWNWNAGVSLTWPWYQGGGVQAQIKAENATLSAVEAQIAALRLQVGLEVEQARLAVRAEKAAILAARESTASAREQLRLAEARYSTGVGNVIELGDAQLTLMNAAAQEVQEENKLASARSQLLKALGRLS